MLADTSDIGQEAALLVQVMIGRVNKAQTSDSLLELERLTDTANARIVGSITQHRSRPTPGFFIGEGKLADIKLACSRTGANLIIFDNDLSAIQVNNLDLALNMKVIDRTELILQIFARRARSAEAQIQVELAQLEYLVSRIPISRKQQRFQGGIGMKGPGESPFQLRNDPMRRRIRDLKKKLSNIQARRRTTRKRRALPMVSLVGYTNAGKSTLMNVLARTNAYVDDRLFATLDTKTRLVHISGAGNVLLTDTVGFIRDLPHGLVASFHSTLEEVAESDFLLVVVDASHPHVLEHIAIVEDALKEMGAAHVPSVLLLNKTDCPPAEVAMPALLTAFPNAIPVSARERKGITEIKKAICDRVLWRGSAAFAGVAPE